LPTLLTARRSLANRTLSGSCGESAHLTQPGRQSALRLGAMLASFISFRSGLWRGLVATDFAKPMSWRRVGSDRWRDDVGDCVQAVVWINGIQLNFRKK